MHTRLVNEKVKPFVAKQLKTVVRSELDTSLEGKDYTCTFSVESKNNLC